MLKNYKKILICITPIIPHLSNEALNDIDSNQNIQWPEHNDLLLTEEETIYVIQINGKKRGLIQTVPNINEENLMKLVLKDKNLKKYIDNKNLKKKIFIPVRLINIIL